MGTPVDLRNSQTPIPCGPISTPVTVTEGISSPTITNPMPGPVPDQTSVVIPTDESEETTIGRGSDRRLPTSKSAFDRRLFGLTIGLWLVVGLAFVYSRVALEYARLQDHSLWFAQSYLAIWILAASSFCLFAGRSWRRYQRLQDVTRLRQAVRQNQNGAAGAPGSEQALRNGWIRYLNSRTRQAEPSTRAAIQRVRCQFRDYSADASRDLDVVETNLLQLLDRRAAEIVDTHAAQTAVSTSLASRNWDMLIVFWQSVRLIDELSQLYASRPGFWGTLRLLRRGLSMIVFAEIANLATQAVTGAVVQKSLALLGGRVAEGTANGVLMLRLGDAVQRECRPAPLMGCRVHPLRRLSQALIQQGLQQPEPTNPSSD